MSDVYPRGTLLLGSDTGALDRAAELLRDGKLVAIPTETVYGLAANALDNEAVTSIFRAKGRPSHNPLIVHVEDATQAMHLAAAWPDEAEKLAKAFWPGPLTLVVPAGNRIAPAVMAGGTTVGLRAPAHPIALDLIRKAGVPLAAPSANRSNNLSPTSAQAVRDDLDGLIDAIVDGGSCTVGIESTVLDLSTGEPRILRPGMITADDIATILGHRPSESPTGETLLKSPGMLSRHYAPKIPLHLCDNQPEPDPDTFAILIGMEESWQRDHIVLLEDPETYGRALYRALKWAECSGRQRIHLQRPPQTPRWVAIHDRLRRAST